MNSSMIENVLKNEALPKFFTHFEVFYTLVINNFEFIILLLKQT